jgi:hypothetical protein
MAWRDADCASVEHALRGLEIGRLGLKHQRAEQCAADWSDHVGDVDRRPCMQIRAAAQRCANLGGRPDADPARASAVERP